MLLQYSGITKDVQIEIDHTMQPTNQISGIKCFNVGCVPLAKYIIKISIVNHNPCVGEDKHLSCEKLLGFLKYISLESKNPAGAVMVHVFNLSTWGG